ncbi:TetR/AcrR family transcriptional regulator [Mycobacterium sp. 852002-40037_SCH5390672]|uniref:TetR/AcrR family transcriptional regulator n=1 Tax=Mycobacterium sp. 852002-40037_SCH5390672 TaxID=1834089 RepID=UPI000805C2F3|nr:TetR/AcrR family transcriptional regulator [Mycobacterium sp. 852002-40037_SCH5390672]OBB91901.1 hypothetical protein A5782_14665 [Mycobacterium sp. 852002-40037_SCH5390672]
MPLSPEDYREVEQGCREFLLPASRSPQTPRQRERWLRIIHATVEVAAQGGYSDARMREVARCAGVSMATVYYYFPSKVHLLTAALAYELSRFDLAIGDEIGLSDPLARLRFVADRLVDAMERSDRITDALTHAYVAAYVTGIDEGEQVRCQTIDLLARHLDQEQHAIAEILADIWTSEIISLVQERSSSTDLRARMRTAIHLLDRHPSNDDTQRKSEPRTNHEHAASAKPVPAGHVACSFQHGGGLNADAKSTPLDVQGP